MPESVGIEVFQHIGRHREAFVPQLPDDSFHVVHVVEDQYVGHQVAELHDLLLLVPHVLGNQTAVAEEAELQEVVELLALVRLSVDESAQVDIADVLEQEDRAQDLAQFLEREVGYFCPTPKKAKSVLTD